MRRALFLCAFFVSCESDVVLGRYLARGDDGGAGENDAGADAGPADAGTDAGVDAGPADAGTDAGVDAGTVDAGTDAGIDAGAVDGGTDAGIDAGAVDAGSDAGLDAGTVDAGSDAGLDAGVDAGPPDLHFDLFGPLVVQAKDNARYTAVLWNDGGTPSSGASSATIAFPLGLKYLSGVNCVDSGTPQITCSYGAVAAKSATTEVFNMNVDAGLGWHSIPVTFQSVTQNVSLAVTGVGAFVVPLYDGGVVNFDTTVCFGTNITSYSMCTPPSLVYGSFLIMPDGGTESDGGFEGVWGQSAHMRNFAFHFFSGPIQGAYYSGASTTPLCFEGVVDSSTGVPFSGAFRACRN